jgi:hypothetical protein
MPYTESKYSLHDSNFVAEQQTSNTVDAIER